jgi:hypothetical protein
MMRKARDVQWQELSPKIQGELLGAFAALVHKTLRVETKELEEGEVENEREDSANQPGSPSGGLSETVHDQTGT